ncbi:hypothetical protein CA51_52470 [Rosistilla oblonga]|uniref:DUF4832 domain-containing protein n=1 Tax=Rosistilla oblonga TaxID=2527990 RepID=UPI00118B83A1|nr:DUF4832 domain-containing protein [Rosistilla oblonga]QDV15333.1 hypothetical protein CA51_52470 [Rosistilla oblonga]
MTRTRPFASLPFSIALLLLAALASPAIAQPTAAWRFTPADFSYSPGPADNPLKGLVPYQDPPADRFPYSMEFNYLPLAKLVTGPGQYDWQPMDAMLEDIASRGRQTVVRVFLEYPGRKNLIPQFLIDGGLKVHYYMNTNTAPHPPAAIETPDYEDPNLRKTMTDFIAAWGARYDGDPRLAYITAGLLGTWGEWHTYPKTELWASKQVQREILDAYVAAFPKTPVLLRYPAGPNDELYYDSTTYPFGYHDDSFAHSTLPTGRKQDDWYFWPKMLHAGLSQRWQTAPIGGEIRPEVWGCCFDKEPCTAASQSFDECRDVTHATWMMDTGLSRKKADADRYRRAIEAVQKMGYDLQVVAAAAKRQPDGSVKVQVTVENRGIAPFYHHGWTARLQIASDQKLIGELATDWSPRMIQPGERKTFEHTLDPTELPAGKHQLQLQIPNPMPSGKPLRFANQAVDPRSGTLTLGTFAVAR